MEGKFNKLKSFLTPSNDLVDSCDKAKPQIGFKVSFDEVSKQLIVKVIGARQLPTCYGSAKPLGYLVKVRVFPEKEKYETNIAKESWPIFNEEFAFTLHSGSRNLEDYFKGKFVSLTAYAAMEEEKELVSNRTRSTLKRFLSFTSSDEESPRKGFHRNEFSRRSSRSSLGSRRTIGAATYDLGKNIFTQNLPNGKVITPDIWRHIREISSGMQMESREGKKGSVEVTLTYGISEDGTNDVIEVSVTKYRCSMQTMREHEKLGGQMYIKIKAFEHDDVVQKMKSDKFDPTISLKLEVNTATLRANVNKHSMKQMKIFIRLMNRNLLGKKTVLGQIEINSACDIWKKIVQTPSSPVTRMIPFE